MRKLKILIVILFGCFLLSACNLFGEETKEPTKGPTIVETEKPLETPTHTPTPEATITEIYVGNLEDFYVCVGDTFNTSSLVIMAKYSDNTTKNISNEVNFSSISTSSPGKKKLNI